MMADRVLAVDGGQSAIRIRHSSATGIVEVEGTSRGGDTVATVGARVGEAWARAGFGPVDRVVLGLTTAPADETDAARLAALVAAATGTREVWVTDDAVTAHAGALSRGWGVSVVAGTGVACLAVPEDGEPRILGGHGFLLGDEGGAFWIGREGLAAVLRAGEGRAAPTVLTRAAERRFGALDDLHVRLHDSPRAVNAIAQLAPDVLEAADAGDAVAAHIVERAAAELAGIVRAGVAAAGGGVAVPVAVGGALLAPSGTLRRRVDAALADAGAGPVATVRTADGSPLDGALALGIAGDPGRYRHLIHVWHDGKSA